MTENADFREQKKPLKALRSKDFCPCGEHRRQSTCLLSRVSGVRIPDEAPDP